MIKVLVNGALGRMGSEVVKTVLEQEDMELVAAVDAFGADKMILVKNGNQMAVATDLKAKLMVVKPDVVVDFTRPDVVMGITAHSAVGRSSCSRWYNRLQRG